MQIDYLRVMLSLLASVAIGLGVIFLMSRYGMGKGRKSKSERRIQVLEIHPLGGRTSIVAVSYASKEILLVVGPGFATVALCSTTDHPLNAAQESAPKVAETSND